MYSLPPPSTFFRFRQCARVNTRKRLHWTRSEREHLTDGSLKGLWNRLTLLQRRSICLVYSAFSGKESVYARRIISCQRNSWQRWWFALPLIPGERFDFVCFEVCWFFFFDTFSKSFFSFWNFRISLLVVDRFSHLNLDEVYVVVRI